MTNSGTINVHVRIVYQELEDTKHKEKMQALFLSGF